MKSSILLFVCFLVLPGASDGDALQKVQLIRYDGRSVNTPAPLLCWHPYDGAEEYHIEVADNSEFGCSLSGFVSDTCHILDMEFSPGVWYWRVSSSNYFLSDSRVDSMVVTNTGVLVSRCKDLRGEGTAGTGIYTANGRAYPLQSKTGSAVSPRIRESGSVLNLK